MKSEFEHWVIRGTEPVLWTVPFRVRWLEQEALCELTMHLNISQSLAVTARMNALGRREGAGWMVRSKLLYRNAQLMPPGDNPEQHFSWERQRFTRPHPLTPQPGDDRRVFLDWVHQTGATFPFCKRREEVDYVFHQFCKAMLEWLINEEKPVDLFFVKLHNWPWRWDWKERVKAGKAALGLPAMETTLRRGKALLKMQIERSAKLNHWLMKGSAFQMIDADVCARTIEVEPTRTWFDVIKRAERIRFASLKEEVYAQEFIASAARQQPRLAGLLATWLATSYQTSALLLESYPPGRKRFVPSVVLKTGTSKERGRILSALRTGGFIRRKEKKIKKNRVFKKARKLFGLPLVRPPVGDMRDGRPDVSQPNPEPVGTAGVLVSDEIKGGPAV